MDHLSVQTQALHKTAQWEETISFMYVEAWSEDTQWTFRSPCGTRQSFSPDVGMFPIWNSPPTGTPGWVPRYWAGYLWWKVGPGHKIHSVLYPKCQVLIPPVPWHWALTLTNVILHMMLTGNQRNHQQMTMFITRMKRTEFYFSKSVTKQFTRKLLKTLFHDKWCVASGKLKMRWLDQVDQI